jgi:tRNA (guanine37-N1)-methyltransferase
MKIDIITLFPGMFSGPFSTSMLKKAADRGLVEINLIDLRQYGLGPRRTVDDTPYGGGDGMLLRVEPVFAAVEAAKRSNPAAKVIVLTPSGSKYTQETAQELAKTPGLILVAGHYEGYDERILTLADYELSVGDYVLTGGEIPAMAVVDSVVRLIPGVLGGEQSAAEESFSGPHLEHPHYTRPEEFRGFGGHHGEVAAWRADQANHKTKKNRPDLLKN